MNKKERYWDSIEMNIEDYKKLKEAIENPIMPRRALGLLFKSIKITKLHTIARN